MTKAEIKQIILEEIELKIKEIAGGINIGGTFEEDDITPPGPEDMPGATVSPFATDKEIQLKQLIEPLTMALFGITPSSGESDEVDLDEMARVAEKWVATPKLEMMLKYFVGQGGVEGLVKAMERINNILSRTQNVGFKSRAKKYQTRLFLDQEGNLDKNRVRGFAELLLNPEGFSQRDIQDYVGFKNSAQANNFKLKLYRAKLIDLKPEAETDSEEISESKKKLEFDLSQVNTPEKLPIDVEEQDLMDNIKKELKSSAEDYQNDGNKETANKLKDAVSWVEKNSLKGKVTLEEVYKFLTEFHKQLPEDDKMFLHEPTILELIEDEFKPYVDTEEEYQKIVSSVKQYLSSKQPQTMSELEKYIKQQIREAKNPLAKKMKEIENQGRVAALETKLAAIAEMIEETNGRLTRIDEDNEFADMMDKNAVKEVRKQLKELERAQAKLQKEYDKVSGGRKKEVVDEDLPVAEDAVDIAVDEVELEEDNFALSERVWDSPTNLELKSLAKKVYSALKSQGYKVAINAGYLSAVKSSDFNRYSEKDKWAEVFFSEGEGGKKPGIDVLWKNPNHMALPGDPASKAPEVYNDFISKLRQSVPELKDTRISKNGGLIGIDGSESIGIYPERGSNLSESILRMQKLANILKG